MPVYRYMLKDQGGVDATYNGAEVTADTEEQALAAACERLRCEPDDLARLADRPSGFPLVPIDQFFCWPGD